MAQKRAEAADLRRAIDKTFAPPAWATFFEVADATGTNSNRFADAIVVSLWPSRGLEIIGMEIKARRTDWLRELRNPTKAEAIAAYCDRWYIVAGEGVVESGELPPAWGLMKIARTKLKTIQQAEKTEAKPLDRGFFVSLCRATKARAEDEVNAIHRRGVQSGIASSQAQIDILESAVKERDSRIRAFYRASGVDLSRSWECNIH